MANNDSLKSDEQQGIRNTTWFWLFSLLCVFGCLLIVYSVYKVNHKIEFHLAAKNLNLFLGTLNTFILLTSGLTSMLALSSIKKGKVRQSVFLQVVTLLLALLFIANRIFEVLEKADSGLLPGSAEFVNKLPGESLFFTLYFLITGLHSLIIVFLTGVFVYFLKLANSGKINSENYSGLENSNIQWQFIISVWVILFPVFYLIS